MVANEYPLGIDVSNNQGGIDWARVASAGVQFAIAKVSEGAHFRDGYFAENWQAMKAHGILRGAYHYALPSQYGPVQEARYFVDAIGLLGQTLEQGDLLALDLEDPAASGDLSGWTLTFLQEVERLAGFKPLVYTSPGYVQAHGLANQPEIGDYGLWCASWGVPTPPQAPAPWDLVAIHQYAVGGPGSIPGVAGECDLNRYNGPIDTLPLYGKPGTVEPIPTQKQYVVGDGILAAMRVHGDEPATDEQFVSPQWSEAVGQSGAVYRWVGSIGRVIRIDPAA
jgi:lysozyme